MGAYFDPRSDGGDALQELARALGPLMMGGLNRLEPHIQARVAAVVGSGGQTFAVVTTAPLTVRAMLADANGHQVELFRVGEGATWN